MADSKHSSTDVASNHVKERKIEEQLRESRKVREEAHVKIQQAEETATIMSKALRRITEAIDKNPQGWDSLFLDNGENR
jgi:hypothetical protein